MALGGLRVCPFKKSASNPHAAAEPQGEPIAVAKKKASVAKVMQKCLVYKIGLREQQEVAELDNVPLSKPMQIGYGKPLFAGIYSGFIIPGFQR